ncbi:MAG: porin family protein [Longimicrobiales bacterium]
MSVRIRAWVFSALTLALLPPTATRAQGTYVGVRGGIGMTDYSLPNLSEDWRSGIVAGAFLAVPFGAHVSVQPEVSWVRKGADWFRDGLGPTRAELDYVGAAAPARISLPIVGGFSVSVLGGPWAGVLARCGTSTGDTPDCDALFRTEEHRSLDIGWDLGLGAALTTGPVRTHLDIRRSRGVTRLLKDRARDNPTTESTQLTVAIGYRIR